MLIRFAGKAVITFAPAPAAANALEESEARDMELIGLNGEALDALSFQSVGA